MKNTNKRNTKNKVLIIVLFVVAILFLTTIKTNAQCYIDYLFPFKIGMTKFHVLNSLNQNKNIYEIRDRIYISRWEFPQYLKDSVYKSYIDYKYRIHQCFKGYENDVSLSFADDKLYKISLELYFKSSDYNECIDNYKLILGYLKEEFPLISYNTVFSDNTRKEQIGEGVTLYKNKAKKNSIKPDHVSINYEIHYEKSWNNTTQKMEKTGVYNYLLVFEIVNCNVTKLDKRGY